MARSFHQKVAEMESKDRYHVKQSQVTSRDGDSSSDVTWTSSVLCGHPQENRKNPGYQGVRILKQVAKYLCLHPRPLKRQAMNSCHPRKCKGGHDPSLSELYSECQERCKLRKCGDDEESRYVSCWLLTECQWTILKLQMDGRKLIGLNINVKEKLRACKGWKQIHLWKIINCKWIVSGLGT